MNPRAYLIYSIFPLVVLTEVSAAPLGVEGRISDITKNFVVIKENKFPLLRGDETNLRVDAGTTHCFVNQVRVTCGTLAAVGYVDHARVTIENGYAVRIDVLQMLQ